MTKSILITGAGGAVGRGLSSRFREAGFGVVAVDSAPGDTIVELDVSNREAFANLAAREEPSVILHLAGSKDVFRLEEDAELSRRINYDLTTLVADIAAESGSHLIFLSSDYVFDGTNAPFSEDTQPTPKTNYGRDKLAAEEYIRSHFSNYSIVRSSGVFGYKRDFVDVVLNSLNAGKEFSAFSNLYNNPTFIGDLFKMLAAVIERELTGTFHASGPDGLSRFDFARTIAEVFSLDSSLIRPDEAHDIRPPNLTLENSRSYTQFGFTPESLPACLAANQDLWLSHSP